MFNFFKKKVEEPPLVLKKGDQVYLKDYQWNALGEDCGFSQSLSPNMGWGTISLKTGIPCEVYFIGSEGEIFIENGDFVMRIYEF